MMPRAIWHSGTNIAPKRAQMGCMNCLQDHVELSLASNLTLQLCRTVEPGALYDRSRTTDSGT
eukprot:666560-Amphidinium_carterae.1